MISQVNGHRVTPVLRNLGNTQSSLPTEDLSHRLIQDTLHFGAKPTLSKEVYATLFETNSQLTPQETEAILDAIDHNDSIALKQLSTSTLNRRGKGMYPFVSYALESRKWQAAQYLIKVTEMPNVNYIFTENLRINQNPDLTRRTNLILEAVYRKAPLFIIQEILKHDNIDLNGGTKINGQNAFEWVVNGLEKSKNFFGFEKFHPYYKSLKSLMDQYMFNQSTKSTFDPYIDPLLIH